MELAFSNTLFHEMSAIHTYASLSEEEDVHWSALQPVPDCPVPDFEYRGPPLNFDLTPIFLDSPSSFDSDSTQDLSPVIIYKEVEMQLEENPLRRKRLCRQD